MYLCIYLSVCLSVYLSIDRSIYRSIYLSSIYLSIDLSIYLSIYSSICLTIYLCEWELGYGITYVPTYIALIIPLPRGHECRPFGSSHYSCRSPRKEHSCRSCDPVVVSKDNSTLTTYKKHISDGISDSQVISRRSPTEPTSG